MTEKRALKMLNQHSCWLHKLPHVYSFGPEVRGTLVRKKF